jgi:hypothetical protein
VGAERRIWLAEAVSAGQLARLETGRTREDLAATLLAERGRVIIGLDFAFSVPAWFLDRLGLRDARSLWACVAEHGEAWLAACEAPFWGRRARPRLHAADLGLRRTERAVPPQHGIRPKSVFQLGGAGAVGTGSLRGMPLLHRLQSAGASIWPYDAPGWPLVVEIYPRLLTGPVSKSNALARERYVRSRFPGLDEVQVRSISSSDDAFDAAVSALVMYQHRDDLASLPAETDPLVRREGRIWHPQWRSDHL